MTLSDYAKLHAGRWLDRHLPPVEQPNPAPQLAQLAVYSERFADVTDNEDDTGMWLPAGLVRTGEQVQVAGRWHTVSGTDVLYLDGEPRRSTLLFDGWQESCRYTQLVYVRDEATLVAAEIGGGCHGVG